MDCIHQRTSAEGLLRTSARPVIDLAKRGKEDGGEECRARIAWMREQKTTEQEPKMAKGIRAEVGMAPPARN